MNKYKVTVEVINNLELSILAKDEAIAKEKAQQQLQQIYVTGNRQNLRIKQVEQVESLNK